MMNGTDWTIETAGPADLEILLPMVRELHAMESIDQNDTLRRRTLGALLGDSSLGQAWFVLHVGQRVGYLIVCRGYSIEFGGVDGFIDEFWIAPRHRGAGGGRIVLGAAINAAASAGIRALHLQVRHDNTNAKRLYAAMGFKPDEKYLLMTRALGKAGADAT